MKLSVVNQLVAGFERHQDMVGLDKVEDARFRFARSLGRCCPHLRGKRPANLFVYGCFFNVEPPLRRKHLDMLFGADANVAVDDLVIAARTCEEGHVLGGLSSRYFGAHKVHAAQVGSRLRLCQGGG